MSFKTNYKKVMSLPWMAWAGIYTLEIWLINLIAPGSLGWTLDDRGTFGDMFGAANSIFSAFAVIGVAWSVSMQRAELTIARDDRDKTRTILKDQQENIKIQRFETTFFQLFTAFQSIIENIDLEVDTRNIIQAKLSDNLVMTPRRRPNAQGRQAILEILSIFEKQVGVQENWSQGKDLDGLELGDDYFDTENVRSQEAFGRAYKIIYSKYGSDIGRYFRSLYLILNLIDQADIPADKKPFYAKIIRAQLSEQESTLLAINYYTPYSTIKFNKLSEYYGMAKYADMQSPLLKIIIQRLPHSLFGRTHERKVQFGSKSNQQKDSR